MAKRRSRSGGKKKPEKPLTSLYIGGGVLLVGLATLVWWSIPGNHAEPPADEAGAAEMPSASEQPDEPIHPKNQIDRPARASSELAIITAKTEDEVHALMVPSEIMKRLDVRHCGTACDAVKKQIESEDGFDVDFMTTEDLILPPKDTYDVVAKTLSPGERDSILLKKNAAIVRVTANIGPDNIGARTAFATAAVLAEALDGFVYDETEHRIETKDDALSHCIKTPLGQPVFSPRQIAVTLYRQPDGTERMLSFGMVRFGAPDLVIRGAAMTSGPILTNVLNAAAAQLALGKKEGPFTITLDDVAKVVGKKPSDLSANPKDARPVVLDVVEAEREDAEPEALIELQPNLGPSKENWDLVVASLFGAPPTMSTAADDKELGEVTKKARASLASGIKRAETGEGILFVKGPFAIAEEDRPDGGAPSELLWVEVASCDDKACTGTLANEPTYASNIAPGKTVAVKRTEIADWMIQQRDGGTAGGESIKLLRARASAK